MMNDGTDLVRFSHPLGMVDAAEDMLDFTAGRVKSWADPS